jgi:hypothetical protein
MTVDDLKEGGPIYVRNLSGGEFNLTLYRRDGQSELVPIPKTFIPVNVTNFASPDMFIKSSDFRRAISSQRLVLIPQKEAEEELKTEDAVRELELLRTTQFSNINYDMESVITPVEVVQDIGNQDVRLSIRDLMVRTDISDDDRMAMLVSEHKTDPLTKSDLEFVLVTTDKNSKVSKWAVKQL